MALGIVSVTLCGVSSAGVPGARPANSSTRRPVSGGRWYVAFDIV
jgi:hypothetical protein